MTKKILIGLFILLASVIVIFSYNFYKNVKAPVATNSFNAIPLNAAFIIQESNFKSFFHHLTSSSIIWEELVNNSETSFNLNAQISFFDSIINHHKISLLTNNQPITASAHLAGAKNYNFIFYVPTITEIDEENLIQEIKTITKSNPSNREYENVNIYSFPLKNQEKIALVYYKNIIAFSYSAILLEDVIRQLNSESSLLNNTSFQKVLSTSGQAEDGNIFINHQYFHKLPSLFLNNTYKEYLKQVTDYATWTALDLTIKNNSASLNGFSFASDSANSYLSIFSNQKAQDFNISKIIPDHTAYLFYYGISNSKEFFKSRKDFLKSKNLFFNYEKYLDEQNEKYGVDLEEELLSFIGNEICFFITEPLSETIAQEKYIACQINDIEKFKSSLENISIKINEEHNTPILFDEVAIYQLPIDQLFSHLLGKPFFNLETPNYCIIDDYIIFGNSEESIKKIISKKGMERTINNDENFQSFSNHLSSSNIFVYNNIARSINLYPHFLGDEYGNLVIEKTDFLRKFEAIAIQVSSGKNNLYYNNIFFKYNPVYKQDTRTVWETKLDSTISSKPEIVVNHTNNTKEIIIQDDGNKLYLISNTGKVLWTKQLQEKIIGKIHQIDVYNNNRLQYLFNTKNKIYLLDRNGNNVEKYPVKLPQPATNGITPLDYDKNKNYRLLIGCADNMVYNYNTIGELVKGWEYQSTNSPANSNIWHFAISGKDYIIIPLKDGTVKVVERSGKDRIKLQNKLPQSNTTVNIALKNDLKNTHLTTIDSTGMIVKLFLNDKLENLSSGNPPIYFDYLNANNDERYEYIFANENKLIVTDLENNKLLDIELNDSITSKPLHFKMPDKSKKIGLVCRHKIYLINEEGSIEDDFPLSGSTPFSITNFNNDNTANLVVGDKNILYMYNLK
ncbi:MAG: DUF3352 domain-containing protein [Flavobacteriales bacterium]|nr:DUF3352 domain-containing protein [Flavobacteriales bacterium]